MCLCECVRVDLCNQEQAMSTVRSYLQSCVFVSVWCCVGGRTQGGLPPAARQLSGRHCVRVRACVCVCVCACMCVYVCACALCVG